MLTELDQDELNSYLEKGLIEFPEPIRAWMQNPGPDIGLGKECVDWINDKRRK